MGETARRPRVVGVFGSSCAPSGSSTYEVARRLGCAVTREGWVLVNGGCGGAMAGSARGAKEAGGQTQGVTLAAYGPRVNRWIDQTTVADTLWSRQETMARSADAFVALPGGTGTLHEVAAVWELLNKGFLRDKALVLLGHFWRPLVGMMCPTGRARAWRSGQAGLARNVAEAVALLRERLAGPASRRGASRRGWSGSCAGSRDPGRT